MVERTHKAQLLELIGEVIGDVAVEEHVEKRLEEVRAAVLVEHPQDVVYESLAAVAVEGGKYRKEARVCSEANEV